MQHLHSILDQVRGKGLKVALPEGDDPRILVSSRRLVDEDLARPVVIAEPDAVRALASRDGIDLAGVEVLSPSEAQHLSRVGDVIGERRKKLDADEVRALALQPVYQAAALLHLGEVDAMVAGATTPTRLVIQAGLRVVGLAEGVVTASSFFLMVSPDGAISMFADCALNVDPDPAQLADIAIATARNRAAVLGDRPLVALLSFSTYGSAEHARVDKVREALRIARERAPDIAFDGELQADTALVASVAETKGASGPVAGHANVLIFPDLDSGNIGYKLVQRMGGVQAIGPFLQGFAKPICDLSRGASVDDVVMASAITLATG